MLFRSTLELLMPRMKPTSPQKGRNKRTADECATWFNQGHGFLCLPVEALLDERLSDIQRRCLMALASHADRAGYCWPGRARLASLSRTHPTNVSKAVRALSEFGWVKVKRVNGRSNHYQLQIPEGVLFQLPGRSGRFNHTEQNQV
ncbi:helix-turn-helix domain-containing protein [Nitrogeniibacter aestuarii]|uniref:helix-turn-helix domain-containing protein n=1 Tax=Nitrogeniibacter aestuarii TaxID=2815343 RepID=UPI0038BD9BD9